MSTAAHNAANIVRTMKSYMSGIGYVWLGARVGRCLNTIIRLAIWLWVNRCAILGGHSVSRLLVMALYYLLGRFRNIITFITMALILK